MKKILHKSLILNHINTIEVNLKILCDGYA